jgi:hypothetical protein
MNRILAIILYNKVPCKRDKHYSDHGENSVPFQAKLIW